MTKDIGIQCNQNEQKSYTHGHKTTLNLSSPLRKVMATIGVEGSKANRNKDMIQVITITKKKAKFLSFLHISFREAKQFLS